MSSSVRRDVLAAFSRENVVVTLVWTVVIQIGQILAVNLLDWPAVIALLVGLPLAVLIAVVTGRVRSRRTDMNYLIRRQHRGLRAARGSGSGSDGGMVADPSPSKYEATYRQQDDGVVRLFLRYDAREEPVLWGCIVTDSRYSEGAARSSPDAVIQVNDGIAHLLYPVDFVDAPPFPLPPGPYSFQWLRVRMTDRMKPAPPVPIGPRGTFFVKPDGGVESGAGEEIEWWPRYLTVGRKGVLVLTNLAGRNVHGFRCEIEGHGVRYVADSSRPEAFFGTSSGIDLPQPNHEADFSFPEAFDAPDLDEWAHGDYDVTWYSYRHRSGPTLGSETYVLAHHRLRIGPGRDVSIVRANSASSNATS